MSEEKRVAEPGPVYGTLAINLTEPLIIEREGKPVVVMLTYEEYAELKATAREKVLRQEQAWRQLDAVLAEVHTQSTDLTPEEIEAEITAARQEVSEARNARRRR